MPSIRIGASKTGQPIDVDLSQPLATAILGASSSGKSVLLSNLILLAAKELSTKFQPIAVDPKLGSLKPLESRMAMPIITEPVDFLPTFQKLEQLLLDRLAEMSRRDVTKLDPIKDGEEFPMVVLIVEELLSVTNNADIPSNAIKAIRDFFLTYMTRCRAANMGFILVSHTFSERETIPVAARSQCRQRFLMRSGINECHLMAEGQDEQCPSYLIGSPGIFYYADGDFNRWLKGKTFYCSDEQYKSIAESYSIDRRDVGLEWNVKNQLLM